MTVEALEKARVIAILRGIAPEALLPTVEALYCGGVRAVEVTFNTPGAPEMVRRLSDRFGGRLAVGAGTVLDREQAQVALSAGADFLLSPVLDEGMVKTCVEAGKVAVPGVMTPTVALQAVRWGAQIVKVFPAITVGTAYFRQIAAPLEFLKMMAVGGITKDNFRSFLDAGACCVGVGGGLADKEKIRLHDWAGLTAQAALFTQE